MLFASFPYNAWLVSLFQGMDRRKKAAAQNPSWGRAPEVGVDWLAMDVLIPSPWHVSSPSFSPAGTDPWGRSLPGGSCRRRRTSTPCLHASYPSRWMRCGRMEEEASLEAAWGPERCSFDPDAPCPYCRRLPNPVGNAPTGSPAWLLPHVRRSSSSPRID